MRKYQLWYAVTLAMVVGTASGALAYPGTFDKNDQYPFTFMGKVTRTETITKGRMRYRLTWQGKCTYVAVGRRTLFTAAHCVHHDGTTYSHVTLYVGGKQVRGKVVAMHPEYLALVDRTEAIYEKYSKLPATTKMRPDEQKVVILSRTRDVAVVVTKVDVTSHPVHTIYEYLVPEDLRQPNATSEGGFTEAQAAKVQKDIKWFFARYNGLRPVVIANGSYACDRNGKTGMPEHCKNDGKRRFGAVNPVDKAWFFKFDARFAMGHGFKSVDHQGPNLPGDSGGAYAAILPDNTPVLIAMIRGGPKAEGVPSDAASLLYNYDFLSPYLRKDAEGMVIAPE